VNEMAVPFASEEFMRDVHRLCEQLGLEVNFVSAIRLKYQGKWMRFPTHPHAIITEPYKSRFFGIKRHRDIAYLDPNEFRVYPDGQKRQELSDRLRLLYAHYRMVY